MPVESPVIDVAVDNLAYAIFTALKQALPELTERVKNIVELSDNSLFIFKNRPLEMDEKAAQALDDNTTREMLNGLKQNLANIEQFDNRIEITNDFIHSHAR